MRSIQFGVRVPNSGPLASIENIVRAGRAAEELGFDSLWVHDHVAWSTEMHRHHISSGAAEALVDEQDPDFYESLTTLGYISALTSTITLGVACMVTPCRNPIYAAKQLSTLDHLSGGRLVVGVGLGSKATRESDEFGLFGVPTKTRAPVTDEYLQAMKTIWTERTSSFNGRYVSFPETEIFPKPKQPTLPLWVGGWTDHAAVRAGRYGEGWIPGWLSPSEMARGREILRGAAAEAGRDGDGITIAVEKLATIARTRDEGIERALPTVRASRNSYERDVDDVQFALDRHIFGSVDDVKQRVDEFVQAGVRHFELKLIYGSMDELFAQMELWAETILPLYD
ncbi:MAG TPA: TIGR03619 family F420-dependent LLM class oxidoreductase [Gaiellaceae bacterium]|nr:TIGR03619 family F420-dependent LLM class oxidoreductase [Gaiellaceae bacterium]